MHLKNKCTKNIDENILNILLFGADKYRMYENISGSSRSLALLKKTFSGIVEKNQYDEIINGKFSRPQILFGNIESSNSNILKFVYYFGHLMNRRDGKVYFAHPASNPQKTSSHIGADDFVRQFRPSSKKKMVFFIDSEDYSQESMSTSNSENVLLIFRRLKNSKNTWRNGGELFTGCLAETISHMHRALPSITFRQLFAVVAHRLGFGDARNCIFLCGDDKLFDEYFVSNCQKSGLWFSERHNLESSNRGSREDGIQALVAGLNSLEKRDEATAILEYLAATDPAEEVKRAAKGVMSFSTYAHFSISKPIESYHQLVTLLPTWLLVPAGNFLMGSDPKYDTSALPEEIPQHKVWLPDFWIAKKPVTRGEWQHFLKANRYATTADNGEEEDISDLPITGVNWFEAREYAKWLTIQYQIQGIIRPDEEIRLPTEAEWEKAARGINGRLFPWGDNFRKNHCNCRPEKIQRVVKTGTFSPQGDSPYGAEDMAGNVWEWTISLWGQSGHKPEFQYPYNRNDGRENQFAAPDMRRIVRGGAFYYFDYCVRTATRNLMYPYTRHSGGGFRLVKVQKAIH